LLIVRELLISPRRYSDLKAALPGAASNLLTARLRELERAGLVRSRDVPPPTPARLYELTPLGCDLEDAVLSLTRWGGHRMTRGLGQDAFRADWLVLALRALLGRDANPSVGSLTATVHVQGGSVTIIVAEGRVDVRLGTSADADVTVRCDPETILAVAAGAMPLKQAIAIGRADVEGTARGRRGVAALFAGAPRPAATRAW
jgi:DNA-binding HxlR family transcriptional regulator